MSEYTKTGLALALEKAKINWALKRGKCIFCAMKEIPFNGKHGIYHCNNEDACELCCGCLPVGQQCQVCGRIAQSQFGRVEEFYE